MRSGLTRRLPPARPAVSLVIVSGGLVAAGGTDAGLAPSFAG